MLLGGKYEQIDILYFIIIVMVYTLYQCTVCSQDWIFIRYQSILNLLIWVKREENVKTSFCNQGQLFTKYNVLNHMLGLR